MKTLSYIIPEDQYDFFRGVILFLQEYGWRVEVNHISEDSDVVLGAILPITFSWMSRILDSKKPFVVWHWDLYSFVDYAESRWSRFLEILPKADAVWSCGYEVARELKEKMGLESDVVTAWIDEKEMAEYRNQFMTNNYVLYAASGCGFGKRIDWAEKACSLLKLPLRVLKNQTTQRDEYMRTMARCKVYLMPAFEESNGTIPAMEAAALDRRVVCSDLPSSREVFGSGSRDRTSRSVWYFPPNDFGRMMECIKEAYYTQTPGYCDERIVRKRVLDLFGLKTVAKRMAQLLKRFER